MVKSVNIKQQSELSLAGSLANSFFNKVDEKLGTDTSKMSRKKQYVVTLWASLTIIGLFFMLYGILMNLHGLIIKHKLKREQKTQFKTHR